MKQKFMKKSLARNRKQLREDSKFQRAIPRVVDTGDDLKNQNHTNGQQNQHRIANQNGNPTRSDLSNASLKAIGREDAKIILQRKIRKGGRLTASKKSNNEGAPPELQEILHTRLQTIHKGLNETWNATITVGNSANPKKISSDPTKVTGIGTKASNQKHWQANDRKQR
jgi:hypothetical protein